MFNQVIILTECLRQKEDQVYQGLLQRARDVTLTQDDVDLLNTCTIALRQKQLFRDFSIFDQKSANTALTTYYFTEN